MVNFNRIPIQFASAALFREPYQDWQRSIHVSVGEFYRGWLRDIPACIRALFLVSSVLILPHKH